MDNEQVLAVNDEAAAAEADSAPKKATRTRRKAAPKAGEAVAAEAAPDAVTAEAAEAPSTEAEAAEAKAPARRSRSRKKVETTEPLPVFASAPPGCHAQDVRPRRR